MHMHISLGSPSYDGMLMTGSYWLISAARSPLVGGEKLSSFWSYFDQSKKGWYIGSLVPVVTGDFHGKTRALESIEHFTPWSVHRLAAEVPVSTEGTLVQCAPVSLQIKRVKKSTFFCFFRFNKFHFGFLFSKFHVWVKIINHVFCLIFSRFATKLKKSL